jgi:hypothetical protein
MHNPASEKASPELIYLVVVDRRKASHVGTIEERSGVK